MRYVLAPTAALDLADVPVTLAEAKAWAGVTHDDDDADFALLLTALAERIEEATGLSFAARTFVYTATADRPATAFAFDLPRRPVASVDAVAVLDAEGTETALALGDTYAVGPARTRLTFGGVALLAGAALRVTFRTAALAPVPDALRLALQRGVVQHYEWRSDVVGAGGAMRLPQGAFDVLRPHLRYDV